jgi:hypothetical protein
MRDRPLSVTLNLTQGDRMRSHVTLLLWGLSLLYLIGLTSHAHTSLGDNIETIGVHRTYAPHQLRPNGQRVIDPRATSLSAEMRRRYGLDLQQTLMSDPRRLAQRLAQLGVQHRHDKGVGEAGEISLLWPPQASGSKVGLTPVLIIGQYGAGRVWFEEGVGVVAGPILEAWRGRVALRLTRLVNRRW